MECEEESMVDNEMASFSDEPKNGLEFPGDQGLHEDIAVDDLCLNPVTELPQLLLNDDQPKHKKSFKRSVSGLARRCSNVVRNVFS